MQLPEKVLMELNGFFKNVLPSGSEVLAYGSRVKGSSHESSDLDLAIRLPNSKPSDPKLLSKLRSLISDSNIPILVDLKEWTELPDSFHSEILKNYVVIFKN